MEKVENMNETMRAIHDTLDASKEGLSAGEIAAAMKRPVNTVDNYLQRLLAHGNVVKTGTCRINQRGRLAYVYATKANIATSKAWIASQGEGDEKSAPKPRKAAPKAKDTAPKAAKLGNTVAELLTKASKRKKAAAAKPETQKRTRGKVAKAAADLKLITPEEVKKLEERHALPLEP